MFDSPTQFCPRCGKWVAIDQPQALCARDHACATVDDCPLAHLFPKDSKLLAYAPVAPSGVAASVAGGEPAKR